MSSPVRLPGARCSPAAGYAAASGRLIGLMRVQLGGPREGEEVGQRARAGYSERPLRWLAARTPTKSLLMRSGRRSLSCRGPRGPGPSCPAVELRPRPSVVTDPRSGPDLNPHAADLRIHQLSRCDYWLPNDVFAGQLMITMCPRSESQLRYMIDIALTTEFAITAGCVR